MKPQLKWALVILVPIIIALAIVSVMRSGMDAEMRESYKTGDAAEKISDGYRDIAVKKQLRESH